jgi:hypothetical protein
MASKNKNVLQSTNTESKTWNFSKGNVQLNFSLRVDIKEEMKAFAELLATAKVAVEDELSKRFPKQ